MRNSVIEVENLTKIYGNTNVLNKFNVSVERGHIYGIIGPNGAGKTTFFKILAGLIQPTSGSISVFGERKNIRKQRSRMSFMIEAPYFDICMTARENMMVVRYVRGIADEKSIDKVLEFVGLHHVKNKKVGQFSLGMKQRLGIAMALMSKPEIMVLDEPVNGLDPEGMAQIRNLLKKLSEEKGVTILISSHILSELHQLATDFVIIKQGNLIDTLTLDEIDARCRKYIAIKTDNINKTAVILEEKLNIKSYKVLYDEEIHIYEYLNDISRISRIITESGQIILKLNEEGESLEEYYLKRVGGTNE